MSKVKYRVWKERQCVQEKFVKLRTFIYSNKLFKRLIFKHKLLLLIQFIVMAGYLWVLQKRLECLN